MKDFNLSKEVSILTISLFVLGIGTGPLLLGPLSEFYGRWKIYAASYTFLFGLTWGVAFAPNAGTFFPTASMGTGFHWLIPRLVT